MPKEIKAGHPHHTAVKGVRGGSRPAVNNNHVAACGESLQKARAAVTDLKKRFPNPIQKLHQ